MTSSPSSTFNLTLYTTCHSYSQAMSRLGPEREFCAHLNKPDADTLVGIPPLVASARVNSRFLGEHRGQTVRLTAKVTKLVGDTATVEASDGGEVRVPHASSCLRKY